MLRRVAGVTRACVRCLSTDGQRKRPLPAIARLDPARTLPVLVRQSNDAPREGAKKRAGGLAVLEANLQGGHPDQVWQAYSDLVQAAHRRHGRHVLTPWDYTRVLRVMNSHGKRERHHVDRVLSVLVAVRSRQRQTIIAFQKATAAQDPVQLRYLKRRLQEWDEVISPAILNSTIGLVGLSLRKAKLEQVDDALSQLLEAETDRDSTRRKPVKLMTGPASMADEENVLGRTIVSALAHLRPRGPFPDLTTYNTLLEIVTRMFHRRTRAAILKQSGPDEDVDRFVEMQNELNDARADEQYAAMTEKMRALDLDVEVGPITLELADKLFHAILHRMRHKSHLEPDAFTYNIMVSMYCQLGQTDEMHRVIRTLRNKGLLTIETINNVMWKWVTWLPTSAAERLSAIDDVVEMYGILRDNLVRREMGAAYAAKGPAKDVVKRMLGIDTLTLVPDKVTYVSLIQIMARSGRFSDALGVFKDLVSTPKAASSEPFQADFPVFDSFFRGFSRYGRPSQLVHYNQQHPEQSEWTAAESADNSDNPQLALWNMDTFREIFDAFLQFRPDDSAIRAAGRSSLPPIELTSESLVSFGDDRNNKRRYSSPYGTLALKDAVHLEQLRRAPSTNQLFWILVALRRVSGDNARWTLAMWEKVDAKFANTSHTDDVFTWTNYSHDHRLNRVLRLLRDSIDGDEISRRLSALV